LNIKFGKFTGLSLPILANFRIINPTNTPLKIENITGDIFINGKLISTVTQLTPFNIAGNSEIVYPVNVQTGLMDAINVVRQFIRERKKFTVTFKGSANSTGILIPIENTIVQL
jgi:LEA14-like dessication related protein